MSDRKLRAPSDSLEGDGFRLRRVVEGDLDFVTALSLHEEIEPFLAAIMARSREELLEEVRAAAAAPDELGRFVIDLPVSDGWQRAGTIAFEAHNRRSRIAGLHAVMLDPEHRRRGLAERAVRLLTRHLIRDLGYHRVQLEVYGFNEPAIRLFEKVGFVREGAKRNAYWRHDAWQDGVLFGILEEEIEES